jgi:hypothetical protein
MNFRVAALYRFTTFADPLTIMRPLSKLCCGLGVKGTLLLAREGINGTIAGTPEAIDQVLDHIRALPGCETLELKFADAQTMPFHRMKVRIKREIVTLGAGDLDPAANAGTYVEPADWNALIARDDVVVIDTRNAYEDGHRHVRGRDRSGDRQLQRLPGLVPRLPRHLEPGRPAAQGGDVLHRRHPLREVDGLPQERGDRGRLPPQGRHPELSGDRAGRPEPVAWRVLRVRRARLGRPRPGPRDPHPVPGLPHARQS